LATLFRKDGLVVSGGRDQSLFGWSSVTGDFSFAKRYCHGSEVSAVDVARGGAVVISGSRDRFYETPFRPKTNWINFHHQTLSTIHTYIHTYIHT
jgi:hypothetical protein